MIFLSSFHCSVCRDARDSKQGIHKGAAAPLVGGAGAWRVPAPFGWPRDVLRRGGRKDVLGLWSSSNEGAKFWLGVLTELKNRGVRDILIACVDGLRGFPQAIESVYPETRVQTCIVHLVRASLNYV